MIHQKSAPNSYPVCRYSRQFVKPLYLIYQLLFEFAMEKHAI
jgi:hypothetical protein